MKCDAPPSDRLCLSLRDGASQAPYGFPGGAGRRFAARWFEKASIAMDRPPLRG